MQTEQRSTLTISQEQKPGFGTLLARSNNTGQALSTLPPSGSYTINVGDFTVTQDFGETTYVFNIGATLTTQPGAALTTAGTSADAIPYQEGLYSGTFEVTASY